MYKFLSPVFVISIFGLPLAIVGLPYAFFPLAGVLVLTLLFTPLVYSVLFVCIAGLLSKPFQKAIVPGRFPRDLAHPVYRSRRLYGLCWTCLFYFKPVYFICLNFPGLKWLTFRLFGYRGAMKFTLYPDTWIRDLPLLDFGIGAYIANRSTLGTNIVLLNGHILVDTIHIGNGATVGHLAIIAPGVFLGKGAEVGTACVVGAGCRIGDGALIQPFSGLHHSSQIGNRSVVGAMSYVGAAAMVKDDIHIPNSSIVPNGVTIQTQAETLSLISCQTGDLKTLTSRLRNLDSMEEIAK